MIAINSKISWKTAAGLVIANMIGTGVFTSLGFQLAEVQNTWSILLLWIIGGMMALIGAFTYAELGTHFCKTGGDYIFLSEVMVYLFWDRPLESLAGLGMVGLGLLIFLFDKRTKPY